MARARRPLGAPARRAADCRRRAAARPARARGRLADRARRVAGDRRRARRGARSGRRRGPDRSAGALARRARRPGRGRCSTSRPRQVLAVAGDRLPARYRRRSTRYRYGPGVCKVDWALDGPIPWTAPEVGRAVTVHVGGTLDEIAEAEADPHAGRHAARPFVLLAQPTRRRPDPCAGRSSRPAGRTATFPRARPRTAARAIEAQVERFAPGFRDRILARERAHRGRRSRRATRAGSAATSVGVSPTGGSCSPGRPSRERPWVTPVRGPLPVLVRHPAGRRGARHVRLARRARRVAPPPLTARTASRRSAGVRAVLGVVGEVLGDRPVRACAASPGPRPRSRSRRTRCRAGGTRRARSARTRPRASRGRARRRARAPTTGVNSSCGDEHLQAVDHRLDDRRGSRCSPPRGR